MDHNSRNDAGLFSGISSLAQYRNGRNIPGYIFLISNTTQKISNFFNVEPFLKGTQA
jgi:hypothetical protein